MELEAFIKKREDHEFSSGRRNGPDFLEFAGEFKQVISQISQELGATLLMDKPGHYYLSWFLLGEKRYAYGNTNDVRHSPNGRRDNILVRATASETDHTGGPNQYTTLRELKERLVELLS